MLWAPLYNACNKNNIMIKPEEVYLIGRLTRTHGIKGEMEIQFTDDAFDRGEIDYVVLLLDGIFVPFFFEEYRFKNNEAALIKFEEVNSEKDARRLVGVPVYYPHAALPADDTPEIRSLQAFVGYKVLLPDFSEESQEDTATAEMATRELGTIAHVATTPSSALLTVETEEGEEVLLPLHDDFVVDYNTQQRYLLLNVPEEILELNAAK